jgi:hypothetical protein
MTIDSRTQPLTEGHISNLSEKLALTRGGKN